MRGEFKLGSDTPWTREEGLSALPCPFCGDTTLVPAESDDPDDDRRLDLRCESEPCAVSGFVVLATQVTTTAGGRADVEALQAVDGHADEAGWGTPPGAGDAARERAHARRKHPARISVEPVE
jgi:hypothetical protein